MEALFESFRTLYESNVKKVEAEVEMRFGSFNGSGNFSPSVSKEQFYRLLRYFESRGEDYKASKNEQKISYHKNDIRMSTSAGKSSFMKKKTVNKIDDKEYGLRLSVASEKEVSRDISTRLQAVDISKKVNRIRYSFELPGFFRFDMDEGSDGKYSVELESLGSDFEPFMKNVKFVLHVLQDSQILISRTEELQVIQYYRNLSKSSKFPGVQPVTLNNKSLDKKSEYALTKKLDGIRSLCVCYNQNMFLISQKNTVKKLNFICKTKDFILDGELYLTDYHIFDMFSDKILKDRVDDIKKIHRSLVKVSEDIKGEIYVKEYVFGDIYNNFLTISKSLNYKVFDGLILVKTNESYRASSPLKWKPVEKITIDFQLGGDDGLDLMVQGKSSLEKFARLKSSKPGYVAGDIVEFSYDSRSETWNPVRHRYDKTKPNFIGVSEDNMSSIASPFNPELLKSSVDIPFSNMRKFHNFIKRKYIEKFKGKGGSVLDLACGKGGDFGKYIDSGFKNIFGFDIDTDSLREAENRSKDFISRDGNSDISIKLSETDLTKRMVHLDQKADLVVCNFAFHYFFKTIEMFTSNVLNNTDEGAYIILTFFDKDRVIPQENASWYIKRVGNDSIEVYLKGSVLNKPEKEFLVDIPEMIKVFAEYGITLVERTKFENIYKTWKKPLSKEEKTLSFMNDVLVFKRA